MGNDNTTLVTISTLVDTIDLEVYADSLIETMDAFMDGPEDVPVLMFVGPYATEAIPTSMVTHIRVSHGKGDDGSGIPEPDPTPSEDIRKWLAVV